MPDKVRPWIAAFVGAMGARSRNFDNALVRYGFGEAAESVQEAFLSGRRAEAVSLVPDKLVDELALVGDRARIAASLDAWRNGRGHDHHRLAHRREHAADGRVTGLTLR